MLILQLSPPSSLPFSLVISFLLSLPSLSLPLLISPSSPPSPLISPSSFSLLSRFFLSLLLLLSLSLSFFFFFSLLLSLLFFSFPPLLLLLLLLFLPLLLLLLLLFSFSALFLSFSLLCSSFNSRT